MILSLRVVEGLPVLDQDVQLEQAEATSGGRGSSRPGEQTDSLLPTRRAVGVEPLEIRLQLLCARFGDIEHRRKRMGWRRRITRRLRHMFQTGGRRLHRSTDFAN